MTTTEIPRNVGRTLAGIFLWVGLVGSAFGAQKGPYADSAKGCVTETGTVEAQTGVSPEPMRALIRPILSSRFAGRVPHEFHVHVDKKTCDETAITAQIRKSYQAQVKPIFESKCFACHNSSEREPIYAFDGIGGRWNKVQDDIDDGLAALDFVADYPFLVKPKGKPPVAPPVKQPALIGAIAQAAQSGRMPLEIYTEIHRGSALTDSEKKTIESWSDDSLSQLSCLEKAEAASNPARTPAANVKQLFEQKCLVCHSNPLKDFGVITDLKHLSSTNFIDKVHPDRSTLYQQVLGASKMQMPPPPASPLTKDETNQILVWIQAGAPAQ